MPDAGAVRDRLQILTIDEAAAYLHASINTMRDWRRRGIGPRSFKNGKRVCYLRSDLDTWVEANRSNGRGGVLEEVG